MLDYKVKIGLVPDIRFVSGLKERKGMFEPGKGVENKEKVIKYIKDNFVDEITEFVDLEWLNEYGLLVYNEQCDEVCEYFKKEKVDAIFIINCNFGNEEACGQVAKNMNVPVLLWGPQDMTFEKDGQRYTDSQCGLFAISKQLRRYNIPFTYIENCPVEDKKFKDGLNQFLSVVTMIKNFKNLKITQVGTRINPFKSVMYNEIELTEKFGVNLQTVNLALMQKYFQEEMENKSAEIEADLATLKEKYDINGVEDEKLRKMLAFIHTYIRIFKETGSNVLASECWSAMPMAVGVNPCLAMSILNDMGYIVTCESDIHGAITNVILACASRGREATVFGEFTTRHPHNPNAELLWHCGPFPYSVKHEKEKAKLVGEKPTFRAKDGEYTIARFQGDRGNYTLLGGEFKTTDGPITTGTYMWAEFKNLSKVERKLIDGPYIHHMTEMYGNYSEVLKEFCKYVPGLEYDPIEE